MDAKVTRIYIRDNRPEDGSKPTCPGVPRECPAQRLLIMKKISTGRKVAKHQASPPTFIAPADRPWKPLIGDAIAYTVSGPEPQPAASPKRLCMLRNGGLRGDCY